MPKQGTKEVKQELPPVNLRVIGAVVPSNEEEKNQLRADLKTMGCAGLLEEPWAIRYDPIVQELLVPQGNQFELTLRSDPRKWTSEVWAKVYGFRNKGDAFAHRNEPWINGKFSSPIDAKNGYTVSDCVDPRERRVLEFVVPIIYPEKPRHLTKEIGNTIFGALAGKAQINWGEILELVVDKLVANLKKRKDTYICPYLFHLYHKYELLTTEETDELDASRKCLELGLTPEGGANQDVVDLDSLGTTASPRGHTPAAGTSSSGRRKLTSNSPKGKQQVRIPEKKTPALAERDPFLRAFDEFGEAHMRYKALNEVVRDASKLLGDCKTENIIRELKKLKVKDSSPSDDQVASMKKEIIDLKVELGYRRDEVEGLKVKIGSLERIQEFIGTPGDIINKARLFDEDVKKEGEISATKIVKVVSAFTNRMNEILADIRQLVYGTAAGPSRPPMPPPTVTPCKERPLVEIKTPLPTRSNREEVAETSHLVPPAEVPTPTPSSVDRKGKDQVTVLSSGRKFAEKKKGPALILEDSDEEEEPEESESAEVEDDSEEEPMTPAARTRSKQGPLYNPKLGLKRKPKSIKEESSKKSKGKK